MFASIRSFFRRMVFFLVVIGTAALILYGIYQYFFDGTRRVYSFDQLHYEVEMLSDGDALVSEERTYHYKVGDFTRGTFELEPGIEDIVVLEKGRPYRRIPDFDEARPEGAYAYKAVGDVIALEWYIKASAGEVRTFTIRYKVKKSTTVYNDCAVYFQKFLSEKNTTPIKNLTASIMLVSGANPENTKIWAHGPAHGNLSFDDKNNRKVHLKIKNVPPKNYVEARFLLDRSLVSGGQYEQNVHMRDSVILEETEAGKKANRDRWIAGTSSLLAYLLITLLILAVIAMRIKKRDHFVKFRPQMEPAYYRDIPENIPPGVLERLFHFYRKKGSVSNQIAGTIMDMIYRGLLSVYPHQENRKTDMLLRRNKSQYKAEEITEFERPLIHFLFIEVAGGGDTVSMKALKKYCARKKSAPYTGRMFTEFTKKLNTMWNAYNYVEKEKNKVPGIFLFLKLTGALFAGLGFLLMTVSPVSALAGAGLVLLVGGALGLLLSVLLSLKKAMLNQRGEDALALWKGFYNFLNDFTLFEEKDLPELFMWEKYLVYATSLGIAEKVIKQLKVRYPQLSDPQFVQNNMLFLSAFTTAEMGTLGGLGEITSTLASAMQDAQRVISNLSSSSSSGSGGGFSSGGSSGGGGAGGSTGGGMD